MENKIKRSWQPKKTPIQKEILAGITGFFAISYIIIVNPIILTDAGIPANLSVFATIFSSFIGSLIMGIWADAPIIITPGMGVNAFFTYTLVVGMDLTWEQAIAISIISSFLYMVIAFTPISEYLAQKIPQNLKIGITAGIGMFLVVLGLEKAGIVKSGGSRSLLAMGNLLAPEVILSLLGIMLTLILFLRRVPGDFIIGIIVISILGNIIGVKGSNVPNIRLTEISKYSEIVAQGDFSQLFTLKFLIAIFSMTMILVFESMGILEGLLPVKSQFKKAFQASSIAALLSGFLGTSPTVAAAESASGIQSGGRRGAMAITSGLLFLAAIFLIPLLSFIPESAIAPVIIITGAIMMQQLRFVKFADFSEWFPTFLILVLIPLTSSISTGLAFGFIVYPICKLVVGNYKDVSKVMYVLSFLFLIQLICESIIGQ